MRLGGVAVLTGTNDRYVVVSGDAYNRLRNHRFVMAMGVDPDAARAAIPFHVATAAGIVDTASLRRIPEDILTDTGHTIGTDDIIALDAALFTILSSD
jgi:hypothetical protein